MGFDVQELAEVDLHITNRCSLTCTHCCFASGTVDMEEMSFAEIELLINDLADLKVRELHITGGEPLMRKDVFDVIRLATISGFHVRLQSNGIHLKEPVVKRIKDVGVNSIMVSVDGYGAANEAIRGRGTYAPTIAGIKQAKETGLHVRVNSVVHCDNMESMFPLMEEMCRIGVDIHSFFYYTPHGRGLTSGLREVSGRMWLLFLERLRRHWLELGRPSTRIAAEQGFVDPAKWDAKIHGCKMSKPDYAQVMSDGKVVPCTLFILTPHAVGNVREQSIKKMWHDPRNWRAYERIRTAAGGDSREEPKGCWAYTVGQNRAPDRDPRWSISEGMIPICPIVKYNVITEVTGPSTADVV